MAALAHQQPEILGTRLKTGLEILMLLVLSVTAVVAFLEFMGPTPYVAAVRQTLDRVWPPPYLLSVAVEDASSQIFNFRQKSLKSGNKFRLLLKADSPVHCRVVHVDRARNRATMLANDIYLDTADYPYAVPAEESESWLGMDDAAGPEVFVLVASREELTALSVSGDTPDSFERDLARWREAAGHTAASAMESGDWLDLRAPLERTGIAEYTLHLRHSSPPPGY
jgi:hypothetical protein